MNRILSLLSLLMLCVVEVNAQSGEQSTDDGITIYVNCDEAPFIWSWNAANGQYLNVGDWPGTNQLKDQWEDPKTGKKFWTWTFPKEVLPISFLFNNGETLGTKQTNDINRVTTDRYFILSWDDGDGNIVFEDITENYIEIPDAEVSKVTLAGNHNGWDDSNQEFEVVEAGKTFKLTVDMTNVNVDGDVWQFKFRPNNQDWVGYWDIYYEGEEPIEGMVSADEAPEWLDVSIDGNFLINLNATERIFTITVTWNGGKDAGKNWSFKIEGELADAKVNTVTLIGNHNQWGGNDNSLAQAFEVVEPGKTFKLTVDMTHVEVEENFWTFLFRPNGEDLVKYWDVYYSGEDPVEGKISTAEAPEYLSASDDGCFRVDLEATDYRIFTITVTWNGGKKANKNWIFKIEPGSTGDVTENDTWTIVGEKPLTGTSWNPTDTKNDMTSVDGVTYTLVKEAFMLKARDYGYKVVKSHDWGKGLFPEGDNAVLSIAEDGEYKVTFTFNAETPELTAVAEKTGDYVGPVVSVIYTVAGVKYLCGSSWDTTDETNDMTSEDGVNYTLVKENLLLEGGIPYGFKVCANHSWDESYGSSEGGNAELTVATDGKYTVTFMFNAQTHEVGAEAVKTGDAVVAEKVWTIAGSKALLGSAWDIYDTKNDMTKLNDGTFLLVKEDVELEANTPYEYKIVSNHEWNENYGANGVLGGSNAIFTVEDDGVYDVTFTWNYETKELAATGQKTGTIAPVVNQLFVVAGTFNNWNVNADYQMTLQDNGLYTYTIWEVELEKNQAVEFKVVDMFNADNLIWYPADANMVFAATQEGTYDIIITFDPDKKEVTFSGERHVELHTYTVTWVNVGHWEQVYAYAWSSNLETYEIKEFMGAYPGKPIGLTGSKMIDGKEYEVYTCTIVDEFPPQNIIFSNGEPGDGNQTTDYAFVDGKEYSEIAPPVEITLNAFGYMPYSSKYALKLTETMGVDAYYAAGVNENGELLFEKYLGIVPARYGLFLVGTPNSTLFIPTAFGAFTYPDNLLKGSVENTRVQPSTDDVFRYTFLTSDESAGFYEVGTEGAISYANMAYIESPVELATKSNGEVKFVLSDNIALKLNHVVEKQAETSQIYNLQGQKLVKAQKGLNIINGKKMFVK